MMNERIVDLARRWLKGETMFGLSEGEFILQCAMVYDVELDTVSRAVNQAAEQEQNDDFEMESY